MGALLLLATCLLVPGLVVVAVLSAVRGRRRRAAAASILAAVLVAAYGAGMLVASTIATTRDLRVGEWKCFDEWCATLTAAPRAGDDVQVVLSLRNSGRREQAPDSPRVWLVHGPVREEVVVPDLGSRIAGGGTRQLPAVHLRAPLPEQPLLVVTEGGFPSFLVIGDDNSPFHPQRGWRLG